MMLFYPVFFLVLFLFNQANAHQKTSPISNKNCTVKYGKRLLKEDDVITVQTKLFKVENCQLQRAYHSCGTDLWFMINIVCGAIQSNQEDNPFHARLRRFTRQKLLMEACCLSTCTVQEMTRYCPV